MSALLAVRTSLACWSAVTALAVFAASAAGAELPPTGTLDLATDGDARVLGEAEGDDAGWAVETAGDVNGDGQDDLLVGAPSADPRGRPNAGSVYVLFGPLQGLPSRFGALGTRGFRIDGAAAGDKLGTSASAVGDVDGDGFGDVLLGAPRWAWGGGEDGPGAAFLVRGRAGGDPLDLADPSPTVTRFNTLGARDQTGMAVGASPDMDGDGRPELIVGAPRADAGGTDAGAVFVLFSSRIGAGAIALAGAAVPGLRLDGVAGSRAGLALDGVGDVNGDGRGDLAVGAPAFSDANGRLVGAGYVVFGSPTPGQVSLADMAGGGYPVRAAAPDGFFGLAVAGLRDHTGDGVADIAFGAPASDRHDRRESGSAYLIAGKGTPDPVEAGDPDRPGLRIDGASGGDRLGGSVADMPDVNADGEPEFAAGAPFADALSRRNAGAITVAFGGGSEAVIDAASIGSQGFRIAGSARQSRLWRLAALGDVDGDGGPDLLVGASHDPGADPGSPRTGAAHIILSPRPPAAPSDPGAEEEVAGGCRAARNVELLIDDSGSMGDTDPQRLRGMAAELLVSKPRNEGEVLGAYEFGSTGSQLFPPQVIAPRGPGSNQPELFERLENRIRANNGGTNYNEAFTGVAKDNPGADARVFLTDGEHNEGQYENWHRGGPPTYVIGLAIGSRGAAARRLARIAGETGGRYFPGVTAQNLQPVLNRIDSRLNCDVDLDSDVDVLTEEDPEAELETPLDEDAHSYDVEVMWGDDDDEVVPESLELLDEDGDPVAVLGRRALMRTIERPARTTRAGELRARGHRRDTFFGLRLNGVRAATLRITYRLTAFRGNGARVIAQAMESRRRR